MSTNSGNMSFVDRVGGKRSGASLGFTDKLKAEGNYIMYLYRGYQQGDTLIYVYIAVFEQQDENWKERLTRPGDINFPAYGVILAKGEGNPTPEVMQEMEQKYEYNHREMKFPNTVSLKTKIVLYRVYDKLGQLRYYYFSIKPDKYLDFIDATKGDTPIDISLYGVTITSGVGTPSQEIMQKMEEEYQFSHEQMEWY